MALWLTRETNGGAQFHQGLIEIAGASEIEERLGGGPEVEVSSFSCGENIGAAGGKQVPRRFAARNDKAVGIRIG